MADGVLLLCKYDGLTAVVKVTESSMFRDLIDKLKSKWENTRGDLVMQYSVPESPNCILADDSDLQNMFMLATSFNLKRVDVVVKKTSDTSNGLCSTSVDINNMEVVKVPEQQQQHDTSNDYCTHEEPILWTSGWEDGISVLGQSFKGGASHFRESLVKCAIHKGFQFTYKKNDKKRITAVCAFRETKGCMWRVHATVEVANGFFYIRCLNNTHTCGAAVRTAKHKRMSSNIVASCIIGDVREDPLTRPINVKKLFKNKYGLDVSYNHAWLGVEKAKNDMFGDQSLSYDDLRWYCETTLNTNPGSRVELEYDSYTGRFKRLFVSYEACIYGFKYCRPMLFIDGTFLKGRYKGNLLSATAKDGDQELFPLAFAVVDSENKDNWGWFLRQLSQILSTDREITFVSDRNAGLLEVMPIVFPHCHHAFCLVHLEQNLRDKLSGCTNEYRDTMVKKLQYAAYAPTAFLFEKTINALKAEGKEKVISFLSTLPPDKWSNAYFKGKRYGEMTSNAAESFNSWIRDARHLPVLQMVDAIRTKLMEQMSTRRKESLMINQDICPKMDEKLNDALEKGRTWHIAESTDHVYEVKSHPSVLVDIEARTCSCCQWQLKGFPCSHAAATINGTGRNLILYVEDYYKVEYYRQTYSKGIYPIPTLGKPTCNPEDVVVLPPLTKKQPGRPKKKRISSRGEKLRQIKCSRCKRYGNHNRKTCNESI